LEPVVNILAPLSPTLILIFLFAPLQLSSKKKVACRKLFLGEGAFARPLLPPQVTPMLIHTESDSSTSKDFLQHLEGHRLFYNSIL